MFDSPMEHCAVCGQMVTPDQALSEYERKHGCGIDQACPLRKYSSGAGRGGPDPQQENPPAS